MAVAATVASSHVYYKLQQLKSQIVKVIVSGMVASLPTALAAKCADGVEPSGVGDMGRCVIKELENRDLHIYVEGSDLRSVLNVPNIDWANTTSNHALEVFACDDDDDFTTL